MLLKSRKSRTLWIQQDETSQVFFFSIGRPSPLKFVHQILSGVIVRYSKYIYYFFFRLSYQNLIISIPALYLSEDQVFAGFVLLLMGGNKCLPYATKPENECYVVSILSPCAIMGVDILNTKPKLIVSKFNKLKWKIRAKKSRVEKDRYILLNFFQGFSTLSNSRHIASFSGIKSSISSLFSIFLSFKF